MRCKCRRPHGMCASYTTRPSLLPHRKSEACASCCCIITLMHCLVLRHHSDPSLIGLHSFDLCINLCTCMVSLHLCVALIDLHSSHSHSHTHNTHRYTYIYDKRGIEIHCLRDNIEPNVLQFLPHHFLLASVGKSGETSLNLCCAVLCV